MTRRRKGIVVLPVPRVAHLQIIAQLRKGKPLRAWTALHQDQSFSLPCTDRYGYPQFSSWTQRPVAGWMPALRSIIVGLYHRVNIDDLAEAGLEGCSIFDETTTIDGRKTRVLFLGAGPASTHVPLSPISAGYLDLLGLAFSPMRPVWIPWRVNGSVRERKSPRLTAKTIVSLRAAWLSRAVVGDDNAECLCPKHEISAKKKSFSDRHQQLMASIPLSGEHDLNDFAAVKEWPKSMKDINRKSPEMPICADSSPTHMQSFSSTYHLQNEEQPLSVDTRTDELSSVGDPGTAQITHSAAWISKQWQPVPTMLRRRGRVSLDVPHLRGSDPETVKKRRLYLRAEQARHRRTTEKADRLEELRSKGFADLKSLKRELQIAQHSHKGELAELYSRYKRWKQN